MEFWHGGNRVELTPIEHQKVREAYARGSATVELRGMIVWLGNLSAETKNGTLPFVKQNDPEKFGEIKK